MSCLKHIEASLPRPLTANTYPSDDLRDMWLWPLAHTYCRNEGIYVMENMSVSHSTCFKYLFQFAVSRPCKGSNLISTGHCLQATSFYHCELPIHYFVWTDFHDIQVGVVHALSFVKPICFKWNYVQKENYCISKL